MKRIICLFLTLVLCTMLACPVLAAEDTFVPSISYKGAPELVVTEDGYVGVVRDANGQVTDHISADCLLVTSVADVKESEQIPEAAAQMLLYVYNELDSGNMLLPAEKLDASLEADELTIRDLLDITWLCQEHPEMITNEGVVFELTFRLNVDAETNVYVMTYKNDEWNPITKVVNNGDGTVTCTFEHLCPVAFAVGEDLDADNTGVLPSTELMPWFVLLVISAGALACIVVIRRKYSYQ